MYQVVFRESTQITKTGKPNAIYRIEFEFSDFSERSPIEVARCQVYENLGRLNRPIEL